MHGCAVTCGHRQWVTGYREERERQEIIAENVSLGYNIERAEWIADHPLPTLKQWMKHREKAPQMAPAKGPQEFRAGDMVWHHERQQLFKVVVLDQKTGALGIQGASSRERLPLDPAEVERRAWTQQDRPAETAKANAQWAADRKAEQDAEMAEMRRLGSVDPETATLQELRDHHEQSLLGGALKTDAALPALEKVRNEFANSFHEHVAKAILDQAADGAPHDAESVEAVLRERKAYELPPVLETVEVDVRQYGPYYPAIENAKQPFRQWEPPPPQIPSQLPAHLDPDKSLAPVDQVQYGLRAWEQAASPDGLVANGHAVKIREYHRGDYLRSVSAKLDQSVQVAMETGADPGYEMLDASRDLVNIPPKLDHNLQPTKDFIPREAVDTTKPVKVAIVRSEATTLGELGLPPKPVLQSVPRVAASA